MRNGTWLNFSSGGALAIMLAMVSSLYSDDGKSAWVAPDAEAKKANPVPADAASLAAGKAAYARNCVMCHGEQGKGDGPASAMFTPSPRDLRDPAIVDQSDGSLFWKLTTGKKPMPAYKEILTEKERWSVVNYVRQLAPPKGAASQPAK
jgi:mono/diheme cytochrome c family protein